MLRRLKPEIVILSRAGIVALSTILPFGPETLSQTIGLIKAAGVQRVVVIGVCTVWTRRCQSSLSTKSGKNPSSPVPHRLQRTLSKNRTMTLFLSQRQLKLVPSTCHSLKAYVIREVAESPRAQGGRTLSPWIALISRIMAEHFCGATYLAKHCMDRQTIIAKW